MHGGRGNTVGELGRVAIAEVDGRAQYGGRYRDATVRFHSRDKRVPRDVRAQRQHHYQRPWTSGDGKSKRIKYLPPEILIRLPSHAPCDFPVLVSSFCAGILLKEQRPRGSGNHQAARHLYDRKRNAEEVEDERSQKLNDREKAEGRDSDSPRQLPVDGRSNVSHQAEKYQGRPNGVNQRQQSCESEKKRVPDQQARTDL